MIENLFIKIRELVLNVIDIITPDFILSKDFIHGPVLSMIITFKTLAIVGAVVMMYLTLIERKVVGRMQNRIGPNRVGKWGLLQPLADGVKMLTKEDIVPSIGDPILHFLAPILILIPSLLIMTVLPFGKNMIGMNLNVGVLYFIALSSTTTIAVFMAAWGSRNKYSLLGGMRSVAQVISYEVPMVLTIVPVLIAVGSLSTLKIVEAQQSYWFILTPWGFTGFIIFFLCATAECNRSPFDLAEAESEIIAGFHTEYSGMKFALFYMAEFINVFALCALTATLFLGGWQGPLLPSWAWFFIKTYALIFIMIWFRGTLPRFRVDQLMGFAWKFILPLSIVNIIAAALSYYVPRFLSWIVPAFILFVTIFIMHKLNRPFMPEKRQYHLAD